MDRGYGVRKGSWTEEEDLLLKQYIEKYGEGKWRQVPPRTGLNRCSKSCRLRWLNYLRPNIKRGQFAVDEIDLILKMHKLLGNRWALIAGRLPGRTANDVKNYWNTHLNKRLACDQSSVVDKEETTKVDQNNSIIHYEMETNVIKPQPRRVTENSNKRFKGNDLDTSIMEATIRQSDDIGMLMMSSAEEGTSETEKLNIRDERLIWLESILLGREIEEEKPDDQKMMISSPCSRNSGSSDHDEIINTSGVDLKVVDDAEINVVVEANINCDLLLDANFYFWDLLLPTNQQ